MNIHRWKAPDDFLRSLIFGRQGHHFKEIQSIPAVFYVLDNWLCYMNAHFLLPFLSFVHQLSKTVNTPSTPPLAFIPLYTRLKFTFVNFPIFSIWPLQMRFYILRSAAHYLYYSIFHLKNSFNYFPLSFPRLLAFFMPARTPVFYKQSFGISLTCPVYGDPSTLSESSVPKKSAQKKKPSRPVHWTRSGFLWSYRPKDCSSVLFCVFPFC